MKNLLSVLLSTFLCLLLGVSDIIAQNIAIGKTARQSSTAYGGEAARALDGNTSGIWSQKSVTHTDSHKDPNQWWEVDLGQVYDIGSIKIYNRTDCCMDRLRDIYILVSETPIQSNNWENQPISDYYAYNEEYYSGQANPIVHQKETRGRYVRIFRQKGAALSLAEVEIYKSQNIEEAKIKAEEEARKKAEAAAADWKRAQEIGLEQQRRKDKAEAEARKKAEEERIRLATEAKKKADRSTFASDGIFKYAGGNLRLTIKKGQNKISVTASSYYPSSLTYNQDINTPNRFIASYMRREYVITFTNRNTLTLNSVKFYRDDHSTRPVALNIVLSQTPSYFKVDGNDIKKELKDIGMGNQKNYVRFSLAVSNDVDGWKAIKIFDKYGNQISLIERDGNNRAPYRGQAFPTSKFDTKVRVEFHKAKMFGVHTYMTTKYFDLNEIKDKELAFTWMDE